MDDDSQMGRSSGNSSKSVPPPPPPPPPPLPLSSGPSKPAPSLAAELSSVSLKHRPPSSKQNVTQNKKSVSNTPAGPFRLPPASSLKKVRPPLPPSSSAQHPPPSGRPVDPLLAEISAVSLKSRSIQVKNNVPSISSVPNDSAGSFRLPTASTLTKKLRPPLPPPPPPSVPPSGFPNNPTKFVPPPPPSQASSNVKKPALPPKKIVNTNEPVSNLESRYRHIFKDLHTLPAPEPFLSTKKQYPSDRKPRGPAPPIPSRSTSISNSNQNSINSSNFNSTPMIHVQLEHQALGVNYPRY